MARSLQTGPPVHLVGKDLAGRKSSSWEEWQGWRVCPGPCGCGDRFPLPVALGLPGPAGPGGEGGWPAGLRGVESEPCLRLHEGSGWETKSQAWCLRSLLTVSALVPCAVDVGEVLADTAWPAGRCPSPVRGRTRGDPHGFPQCSSQPMLCKCPREPLHTPCTGVRLAPPWGPGFIAVVLL